MNNISVTRTRNERIEFMNFNKIIKEFKNSRKSLVIWKEKKKATNSPWTDIFSQKSLEKNELTEKKRERWR